MEFKEKHTTENIILYFKKLLEEWEIDITKISAIVTDGVANIVSACTQLFGENRHLHCFAMF